MFANCHIIILSRYPVAGKTKTRLIPLLGAEKAAQLQRKMTEKITAEAAKCRIAATAGTTIFYTDGSREKMTGWLGLSFDYHRQIRGDIGKRMEDAFSRIFSGRKQSVILIGSDIPEITAEIIMQGFISLENHDTVIGPAADGGYYLIGMKSENAPQLLKLLFHHIPWSTGDVLRITAERLADSEHSCFLLPVLQDIDRPEDLDPAKRLNLL